MVGHNCFYSGLFGVFIVELNVLPDNIKLVLSQERLAGSISRFLVVTHLDMLGKLPKG